MTTEEKLAILIEGLVDFCGSEPLKDPELDPMSSYGNADDVFCDGGTQADFETAEYLRGLLERIGYTN